MKPSFSTLPSSSWLVATVVPWLTAAIASPSSSRSPRTLLMPARKPSAGLLGVDGVFVVTTLPVVWSNATTSVKVPPVSMPIRMWPSSGADASGMGPPVVGAPSFDPARPRITTSISDEESRHLGESSQGQVGPALADPGRLLEGARDLQQSALAVGPDHDLDAHRPPLGGEAGGDRHRRTAGDGDEVRRAHPVEVGRLHLAVDVGRVLLV